MTSSSTEQKELVAKYQLAAKRAKLRRDEAKSKLHSAQAALKKPNVYLPGKHIPALCVSGLLAIAGIGASLEAEEASTALFGVGTGAAICLTSNTLDAKRQQREKEENVNTVTRTLNILEEELYSAVVALKREQEVLHCIETLDISRDTLEYLQSWMANPRTGLRNLVIQAITEIKKIHSEIKNNELKGRISDTRKKEQEYRILSSKILSEDFQEVRSKIDSEVRRQFHTISLTEKQAAIEQVESTVRAAQSASVAATATAVVGASAVGAGLAKKAGAGDNFQTAAAVVGGVGALIGLGGLLWDISGGLAQKIQENNQINNEKSFQNAVNSATEINGILGRIDADVEPSSCVARAKEILEKIKIITKSEVYKQDELLREYTTVLCDVVKDYIKQNSQGNSFGIFKFKK